MTKNPYFITLLTIGGVSVVVAIMLSLVLGNQTEYDVDVWPIADVAVVAGWMFTLIGVAGVSGVGALVLGGVSWAAQQRDADAEPATPAPAHVKA